MLTETLNIIVTRTKNSRLTQTNFNELGFGKVFADHMLVGDYVNGQWSTFEVMPYGDLSMSPAISVLHYGQAFFEGLKAYKHVDGKVSIFRPYKNAERFNRSAERMSMPVLPEDIFVQCIAKLVSIDREWVPKQQGQSLYIRPFMFATDAVLGVQPSSTYKFVVLTSPVAAYFTKYLKVKIETHYSRASEGGFGYAKCAGNYAGALLPTREAMKEGFDQLIWTDAKEHNYVEEMGAANVMFIQEGKLITPSTRDTILKGITRDSIITLAKNWGIPVEERRITVEEILEGINKGKVTEAFGVGTAATIAPIAEIHHQGKNYILPDPSKALLANKLLQTLNDIRYGLATDEFDWNYMVD